MEDAELEGEVRSGGRGRGGGGGGSKGHQAKVLLAWGQDRGRCTRK